MELKPYQQQILDDLQRFMQYVQETKNIQNAFHQGPYGKSPMIRCPGTDENYSLILFPDKFLRKLSAVFFPSIYNVLQN